MDFRLTEDQLSLRKQIADFAKKELPEDWGAGFEYEEYCAEFWPFTRRMARKLGQQGWLGMGWPEEYGGTNRSFISQMVYYEEAVYHRIPAYDMGIGGVLNVGPLITAFGTEEQKRQHLPNLAKGLQFWCIGYSEPDAGSDLRSLRCRAIGKGSGFVIRGNKMWTSAAQIADWCWLLARTGPDGIKGQGMTIFLVNMKSKGVSISPIRDICGFPSFNQVFFDEVYVGRENVLGEISKAWDYMPLQLFLERTAQSAASTARARRLLDDTIEYFKNCPRSSSSGQTLVRHRLAELLIEAEIGRLLAYRSAWLKEKGLVPEAAASIARVFASRVEQRTASAVMGILGPFSQLKSDSPWVKLKGHAEHLYLCCLSDSLLGGTTEIQKNIIALRGLGLPRK